MVNVHLYTILIINNVIYMYLKTDQFSITIIEHFLNLSSGENNSTLDILLNIFECL